MPICLEVKETVKHTSFIETHEHILEESVKANGLVGAREVAPRIMRENAYEVFPIDEKVDILANPRKGVAWNV